MSAQNVKTSEAEELECNDEEKHLAYLRLSVIPVGGI